MPWLGRDRGVVTIMQLFAGYPLDLEKKPVFGRHEKFPFRYSWPKKGVDAVAVDPYVFTKEEALVLLGVGRNMVRAIRHWGLALTVLTEESERGNGRSKPLIASSFGKRLLADDGWDPYLEDVGSLWLLHWKLSSNTRRALIWHVLFSAFYEVEFTRAQIVAFAENYLNRLNIRVSSGVVTKEIDVFLRTYVPARRPYKQKGFDEGQECPLVELGLIRFRPSENVYQFSIGHKTSLPTAIFGYALFEFLSRVAAQRPAVSFGEIAYGHGSPGQIFKLDENSTVEYLEKIAEERPDLIRLTENAGLQQIYLLRGLRNSWPEATVQFLREYYESE